MVQRRLEMVLLLVFLVLHAVGSSAAAQNEPQTATATNFEGFGDLTNVMDTEKTKANLSCESGDMVVKLQFAESFRGVIYADRDKNSPCKKYGDGSTFYVFQIPLQGCGTKERVTSEYRMFVNDIVVRFHPSLELEVDEVKTILCRYPPPVAPLPPVAPPIPPLPVEEVLLARPRRLSEVELMLIVCAILFLGLLLLGVGLAYYCLKKRNIKIVKRRPISIGPPSEITKISGSTLGPLSSIPFDGIRIPRATAHSTSGSEAALLTAASAGEQSDTITSDYPSESPSSLHSDLEEVETVRMQRSMMSSTMTAAGSGFDNRAYDEEVSEMMRNSSSYTANEMLAPPPASTLAPPPGPHHDRIMTMREEENREEFRRVHSMLTRESASRHAATEPPVYARIRKRQMEQMESRTMMTESMEEDYSSRVAQYPAPAPSTTATPSLVTGSIPDNDLLSVTEFSETVATKLYKSSSPPVPPPQPQIKTATETRESRSEYSRMEETRQRQRAAPPQVAEYYEPSFGDSPLQTEDPPQALGPAPQSTRHLVDDRYLSTVTETRSSEDMTRTTRDVTETHVKEVPVPRWDVMIRTYPPKTPSDSVDGTSEVETWDDKFSVVSERPQTLFESAEDTLTTMEIQSSEPPESATQLPPPNWDVLIRVLQQPPTLPPPGPDSSDAASMSHMTERDGDDALSVLSEDDREKWRAILTTDSTLRTLLTEARSTEEFEQIRRDERYERLFDQPKWDVIIRILSAPHQDGYGGYESPSDTASMSDTASYTSERPAMRYLYQRRRSSDAESTRGGTRRSALPPVYESPDGPTFPPSSRGPRSSNRTSRSEFDGRSLTEDEVNFARSDRGSIYSENSGVPIGNPSSEPEDASGYLQPRRFHRPSLLRSSSEVLESLDTIEKDSLDGHQMDSGEFNTQHVARPILQRFATGNLSPNDDDEDDGHQQSSSSQHHRAVERSSTEITVKQQTVRNLRDEDHWRR